MLAHLPGGMLFSSESGKQQLTATQRPPSQREARGRLDPRSLTQR